MPECHHESLPWLNQSAIGQKKGCGPIQLDSPLAQKVSGGSHHFQSRFSKALVTGCREWVSRMTTVGGQVLVSVRRFSAQNMGDPAFPQDLFIINEPPRDYQS